VGGHERSFDILEVEKNRALYAELYAKLYRASSPAAFGWLGMQWLM